MKKSLEVGQILWLKVRYQIDIVADVSHPMLIAKITEDYIEVIAIDKTAVNFTNYFTHIISISIHLILKKRLYMKIVTHN